VKVALVVAQVAGYALPKLIGVEVIQRLRRASEVWRSLL